jgi:hypothetical protein
MKKFEIFPFNALTDIKSGLMPPGIRPTDNTSLLRIELPYKPAFVP